MPFIKLNKSLVASRMKETSLATQRQRQDYADYEKRLQQAKKAAEERRFKEALKAKAEYERKKAEQDARIKEAEEKIKRGEKVYYESESDKESKELAKEELAIRDQKAAAYYQLNSMGLSMGLLNPHNLVLTQIDKKSSSLEPKRQRAAANKYAESKMSLQDSVLAKMQEDANKELENFFKQYASKKETDLLNSAKRGLLTDKSGNKISGSQLIEEWMAADWWNSMQAGRHAAQRDQWAGQYVRAQELKNSIQGKARSDFDKQYERTSQIANAVTRYRKNPNDIEAFNIVNNSGLLDSDMITINTEKENKLFKNLTDLSVQKRQDLRDSYNFDVENKNNTEGVGGLLNKVAYDRFASNIPSFYEFSKMFNGVVNNLTGERQAQAVGEDLEYTKYKNFKKYNRAVTDQQKYDALNDFNKDLSKDQKKFQDNYDFEDNIYKNYDASISDYYKQEEQKAQDENFFSLSGWHKLKYGSASTLGSSNADPVKSVTQQLLSLALAFSGGGAAAKTALAASSFAIGNSAARTENNAEVAQAYIDRLKREALSPIDYVSENKSGTQKTMLDVLKNIYNDDIKSKKIKLTGDDENDVSTIVEAMLAGKIDVQKAYYDVEAGKLFRNAALGAEGLFDKDMVATASDNVVDLITAGFTPFKTLTAGKYVRPKRLLGKAFGKAGMQVADKVNDGLEFVTRGTGSAFEKAGFLGPVGQVGTATGRMLSNVTGLSYATSKVGHAVGDGVAWFVDKFPKGAREFLYTNKRTGDILKKAASNFIARDFSERVEEGKQQLNSEMFTSGALDYKQTLSQDLFSDFMCGAESAKVAAGMYLGQRWTNDAELANNIASVLPGGGSFHNAIRPMKSMLDASTQLSASWIASHNMYIDKEADRLGHLMGFTMSKIASSPRRAQEFLAAFDEIDEYNKRAEAKGFDKISQETAEELKRKFRDILLLQNDEQVRKAAENAEIQIGSDRWHKYISQLSLAREKYLIADDDYKASSTEIDQKIQESIKDKFDNTGKATDQIVINHIELLSKLFKKSKEDQTLTDKLLYEKQLSMLHELASLLKLQKDIDNDNAAVATTNKEFIKRLVQDRIDSILESVSDTNKEDLKKDASLFINDNKLQTDVQQDFRDRFYHFVDKQVHTAVYVGMTKNFKDGKVTLANGETVELDIVRDINELERGDRDYFISDNKINKFFNAVSKFFGPTGIVHRIKDIDQAIEDDKKFYQAMQDRYVAWRNNSLLEFDFQKALLQGLQNQLQQQEEAVLEQQRNQETAEIYKGNKDLRNRKRIKGKIQQLHKKLLKGKITSINDYLCQEIIEALMHTGLTRGEAAEQVQLIINQYVQKPEEITTQEQPTTVENVAETPVIEETLPEVSTQLLAPELTILDDDDDVSNIAIVDDDKTYDEDQSKFTVQTLNDDDPTPIIIEDKPVVPGEPTPVALIKGGVENIPTPKPINSVAEALVAIATNGANSADEFLAERIADFYQASAAALSFDSNPLTNPKKAEIFFTKALPIATILIAKGFRKFYDFCYKMMDLLGEDIAYICAFLYKSAIEDKQFDEIRDEFDANTADETTILQIINGYRASKQKDDNETPITKASTIEKIHKQIQWTKDHVLPEYLTGSHYFVLDENGKIQIRSRVHNIISDLVQTKSYELIQIDRIVKYLINKNIDQLIDYLQDRVNNPRNKYANFKGYLAYLKQLKNDNKQFEGRIKFTILEGIAQESLRNVSNLTKNGQYTYEINPFLFIGNMFDELYREFFLSDSSIEDFIALYNTFTFKGELGESVYISQHMDFETFKNVVENIGALKTFYKDTLGWELFTDTMVLTGSVNGELIAGVPDMIAVDLEGYIHLIDFKTTKLYKPKSGEDRTLENLSDRIKKIPLNSKGQPAVSDGRLYKRTTEELYSMLLTAYSMMIDNIFGKSAMLDMSLMFIPYKGKNESLYIDEAFTFGEHGLYSITKVNEALSTHVIDVQLAKLAVSDYLEIFDDLSNVFNNLEKHINEVFSHINKNSQIDDQWRILYSEFNNLRQKILNNQLTVLLTHFEKDAQIVRNAIEDANKLISQYNVLLEKFNDLSNKEATQSVSIQLNQSQVAQQSENNSFTKNSGITANQFNNLKWDEFESGADKSLIEELQQISAKADFVTQSIFKVVLPDNNNLNNIWVEITYKGKTYPKCKIWQASDGHNYNIAAIKLQNAIKSAISSGKTNLVFTGVIQRTYGIVDYNTSGEQRSVLDIPQMMNIFNDDPYQIEYVSGGKSIGIVHLRSGGEKGIQDPSGSIITSYPATSALRNGDTVILMRPRQDEGLVELGHGVTPVALRTATISPENAKFLVEMLSSAGSIEDDYRIPGTNTILPITKEQILSMFLPLANKDMLAVYKKRWSIRVDGNLVYFIHKLDKGQQPQPPYNLSTEGGRQSLMKQLQRMYCWTDSKMMSIRLNDKDSSNIFRKLGEYVKQNGPVKIGTFTFEESDFENPNNPTQAMSYLGWMMKNNILTSSFTGLKAPLISFSSVDQFNENAKNVGLLFNVPVPEVGKIENETPIPADSSDKDILSLFGGFDYDNAYNKSQNKAGTLNVEEALRYLTNVFGESFSKEVSKRITDDFIEASRNGSPASVGRFMDDMIWLSSKANLGVEYHEAFHRVVEALIPDDVRSKVYREYRRKIGYSKISNKEVAEGLANEYENFQLIRRDHNNKNILTRVMYFIYDYITAFAKALYNRNLSTFKLYVALNSGKFKNKKRHDSRKNQISAVYDDKSGTYKKEAFITDPNDSSKKIKKEIEFENVFDSTMYNKLIDFFVFAVIQSQKVSAFGDNVDVNLSHKLISSSGIQQFVKAVRSGQQKNNIWEKTYAALEEMMQKDKWETVVMGDIKSRINQMSSNDAVFDLEETEREIVLNDANTGDFQVWLHEDYEYSRFERTGKEVKFFFSVIPDKKIDRNTGREYYVVNELGLPQFIPTKRAYNTALNLLNGCETYEEFIQLASEYGKHDPMFKRLSAAMITLLNRKDADSVGLFNTIFNTIKASKNSFNEVLAHFDDKTKRWSFELKESSSEYSARMYTKDWFSRFMFGKNQYFDVDRSKFILKKDGGEAVRRFRNELNYLINSTVHYYKPGDLSSAYYGFYDSLSDYEKDQVSYRKTVIKIDGKLQHLDWSNEQHLNVAKDHFLQFINSLGVQFSRDELEFTLASIYKGNDAIAFSKFVQTGFQLGSKKIQTFPTFIDNLKNIIQENFDANIGAYITIKTQPTLELFSENGFLKILANYKYAYNQAHSELCVTGIGNKKQYTISDSTVVHDITSALKRVKILKDDKGDYDWSTLECPDEIKVLFEYSFCMEKGENGKDAIGSLILKQALEGKPIKVNICQGFKSKVSGAKDSEYVNMSDQQDYIVRATILQNGGLMLPVLSDKSTCYYITGLDLPGLNYNNIENDESYDVSDINHLKYGDSILDQMIEYAYTEYVSAIESLYEVVEPGKEIENFNDKNKNGSRMNSLNRLFIDGKWVNFYNEKNPKEGLRLITEKFFNKTREEQRVIMNNTLKRLALHEYNYMVQKGLIKTLSDGNIDINNSKLDFDTVYNISNEHSIAGMLYKKASKSGVSQSFIVRLAVMLYTMDISLKSVVSKCETERVFSGNPAFYKTKSKDNKLIDVKTDQSKRFGGLSSTGVLGNLAGLSTYNCAEVANEMVSSQQYDFIKQVVENSEYRSAYRETLRQNPHLHEIYEEDTDSLSDEEIKKRLEKEGVLDSVYARAEKVFTSYKKGIDVADGAAYVSADMFENLLRSQGSWNNKIEKAFNILKNADKIDDIMTIDAAYLEVFTQVIGNQKYTAFGFREEVSEMVVEDDFANQFTHRKKITRAVPYYNKMALFPIFECLCHKDGRMKQIYDKMQKQKVDMLMIHSSVKLGGQGSVTGPNSEKTAETDTNDKIPFESKDFKFNVYKQHYKYLRKQLNTDPNEKEGMSVGTLAMKVALANLIKDRVYNTPDGKSVTGQDLLNEIMKSLNMLSDLGVAKLKSKFYNEDGTAIDTVKFSKFVQEQLANRGASNELINSIKIVQDGEEFSMNMPLAATSSQQFIESILASVLNKEVVEVSTPGAPFILRSVWGHTDKPTVLSDTNYNLRMINEEGSMDCIVSLDYFVEYDEQGRMYFKLAGKDCLLQKPVKTNGEDKYEYHFDKDDNPVYQIKENNKWKTLVPGEDYDGFEDTGKKDKNGKHIIKPYKLEPYRENGVVKYIHKYINDAVHKRSRVMRNMSFKEARQWLIDNGVIGYPEFDKDGKTIIKNGAKTNILSYRIPTQAQSSIHALRCVDVLPAVRDTVILPEDFTKITGADFDIDKLFMSALNYDYSYKNGIVSVSREISDKNSKEWHLNNLLDMYIGVLLDIDPNTGNPRNANVHYRSIDDDTNLVKDVLKDIEESSVSLELLPYQFGLTSEQNIQHSSFMCGKSGIGPFALNNNGHILAMLYGLRFKQEGFLSHLGTISLSNDKDRDGNQILSWLSAMINAHVDMAKDPYISRLNVNKATYNLTNLLLRLGYGKQTFYFLSQPILKEIAQSEIEANSSFQDDPHLSKRQIKNQAADKILHTYFNDKEIDWINKMLEKDDSEVDAMIKAMFDEDVFRNHIKNPEKSLSVHIKTKERGINKTKVLKLDSKKIEALSYIAYRKFDPYAEALSLTVKYSKIDTKKQGKNAIEQILYLGGVKDVFEEGGSIYSMFEPKGISALYEQSFIKHKTQNAINLYLDMVQDLVLSTQPGIIAAIEKLHNEVSNGKELPFYTMQTKDIKKYLSVILASIKSEFFNDYIFKNDIDVVSLFVDKRDANGNFVGKPSIAERVARLKILIETNPEKYGYLRENAILNTLVEGDQYEGIDVDVKYKGWMYNSKYKGARFLKPFNGLDDDSLTGDLISESWEDLLTDTDENIRQLGRDLIVYSFLSSGDNAGFTKFFKYVPSSWRKQSGYANFIERLIEKFKDPYSAIEIDIDDIIKNNVYDDFFVKEMKTNEYLNLIKGETFVGIYPIITGLKQNKDGTIALNNKQYRYFKIRSTSNYKEFTLYKLVGYGNKEVDGKILMYPIYVRTEQKGIQSGKQYQIIEYGRRDNGAMGFGSEGITNPLSEVLEYVEFKTTQSMLAYAKQANLTQYKIGKDVFDIFEDYEKMNDTMELSETTSPSDFDIYKLLGTKTKSEHVEIVDWGKLRIQTKAIHNNGIIATRIRNTNEHFGNPFTHDLRIADQSNLIKVDTIEDAVRAYIDWLTTDKFVDVKPEQRAWILEQFKSGRLKGQRILYYSELNEPSHATALDYLINKYNWITSEIDYNKLPINIYAGTGENTDLSNFAIRPFVHLGQNFDSVEQAFLMYKYQFVNVQDEFNRAVWYALSMSTRLDENATAEQIVKYGSDLKRLGGSFKHLNKKGWDGMKHAIMKQLLKDSFEQNPKALKRLLDTGNAPLTHVGDNTEWKTWFPKLLMEVRSELSNTNGYKQTQQSSNEDPSLSLFRKGESKENEKC